MTSDPLDEIVAALARLRGPRPRPPWEGGGPGRWGRGGPRERDHEHGEHPRGGMPPWAGAHGRMAGLARLRMLEALAAASEPLSVSELAVAIGVDQPRASRLVQQAADHGFVRREADPSDARRTRIALTDEGSAIVRSFRGERREAVREALDSFSDADRAELARLLTKLAEAWPRS
ncbi:MarR family winged helix-turn-helix transcriptional regulator [Microbacterium sp. P05]|uniref:MarR family winged helix-turn-helix transcriptional regulator n=1 Tax=Microbacterium sp. P05 TaxID=3366948 RepID=UPI003746FE98